MDLPRIPEYFANKCVLVTGATGFFGKVLIEKLLRSCPDIGKIYVLIRSKATKPVEERWKNITDDELFNRLKSERPGVFERGAVEVVEGDVSEKRLGLSKQNYIKLQEKVSIVFHAAASVRFNDPLKKAIFVNLRGTREVVELAVGMKNLEAFIHVSTAFSNCDRLDRREEKFYPPPADWRETIKIAEKMTDQEITYLQLKYLEKFPNTYTFTKNLAEDLVREYMDRIPVVVVRPSIVIPIIKEPFQGWVDNLNGPMAYTLLGTGFVRIAFCRKDSSLSLVPVDIAINEIIIVAWAKGIRTLINKESPIYNLVDPSHNVTNLDFGTVGKKICSYRPFKYLLWNTTEPVDGIVENEYEFRQKAICYHILPSIIIDRLLKIYGRKPMVSKLQKIYMNATLSLKYFSLNDWKFPDKNMRYLVKQVLPEDQDEFYSSYDVYKNYYLLVENGWIFIKKIYLKDTEDDLPLYRKNAKMLKIIDDLLTFSIRGILAWTAYKYIRSNDIFNCLEYA